MLTINLQQTIDISKQHFTDHSGFNTRKICVNPFPSKDVSIRPMFCHAAIKDFCKEFAWVSLVRAIKLVCLGNTCR